MNNLNIDIYQGDLVGLIGPNGAGKTTVFNLLTGFLRPDNGKIIFNGMDITGKSPHYIAKLGIIRTFQLISLFPHFTVLQNINIACYLKFKKDLWKTVFHTSKAIIKERQILSEALEITHFVGLEPFKNQLARTLPQGYKRILAIAIALAAAPKLLLLDEPLSGMNTEEVDKTMALIRQIWKNGVTIFLIEHNMRATMNLCEKIIVLDMGRKICEGTPDVVRTNKEVIKAYLGEGRHVAA